jgi:hypothetical protein
MWLPLSGERTLPTLLLLSSRHRIGSPMCHPFKVLKQTYVVWCLHLLLNNFACVRNSASSLLLRTRFCTQRWRI